MSLYPKKLTFDELISKESKLLVALNQKSIEKAKKLIAKNEFVHYAGIHNISIAPISGVLSPSSFDLKNKISCVFVVTDKRVFCCREALTHSTSKQISLKNIRFVDNATTFGNGIIRISDSTGMFVIDTAKILTAPITHLIMQAQQNIANNDVNNSDHIQSTTSTNNDIEALERLKALLDSGALTQEEFDIQKQKILK